MSIPPLPRWARAIDILCLLLVIAAAIVAMAGGFRVRVGGVRIALTSPYRLLIWAAVLAIVRHVAAPQSPIYRDLPPRFSTVWTTPAVRTAVAAVLGTRPAILFAGYLAIFVIGYAQDRAPWRLMENEFGNLQARWDTGWYLGIAINGYTYVPGPEHQQGIVFFPAWPMLVRLAGRLFGGSPVAYAWGATVIALLAFGWALVYLYRLARDLLAADDVARRSVWLLATFPFALFYSAVYTESLFLLGALGAFYHFRRREFRLASVWGLLVGLTRPNGCFLSVPLAILAVAPWLPRWLKGADSGADPAPSGAVARRLVPAIATAAMPGIGMLIYSAFIWSLTGNPFAWAEGHVAWGRRYQGLSVVVTERYEFLATSGVYAYTSQAPLDLLNALAVLFVIAAAWPAARRLGLAYAVFILINMLPPLAAGGLMSAGRFSSVLFPAFVWLASVVPERHWPAWIASFMALQAFNATLFYTWRPLY